jgi:hypothetical protein
MIQHLGRRNFVLQNLYVTHIDQLKYLTRSDALDKASNIAITNITQDAATSTLYPVANVRFAVLLDESTFNGMKTEREQNFRNPHHVPR